ncbi:MAG TPA: TonB-dependent receptor [Bacteroidetes bacterium]|nr:TonB-dependent receptor [Bacteroidota bacterium]
MKLNLTPQLKRRLIGRAWLIRLVAYALILFPLFTNAQGQKTLKIEKGTLEQAITKIRTTFGVVIAFNKADIQDVQFAGGDYKNISVEKVLEAVLKGSGFTYQKNGSSYVVLKSPPSKSPNVQAGGDPGTLKGRIVEFESSQPLPGATVYIIETKKGMQTNADGYYLFNNLPAGKYTLQVSFIGYNTAKLPVEVKPGKEETFDVKLQGSNSLSEVVVSGVKKSRAPVAHTNDRQVLQELKAAQSVVSGISSEQISKSADRNAAEVVQKISGVTIRDDKFIVIRGMNERYNLTYLNGNIAPSTELYSRAFSLDLIPTRIIDKILVYKSPAPDLLADMTGGAVKIFTKDAKTVKHFDLELQTGYRENTSFNKNFLTYQGGKFDFLGFDDGARKLPGVVPNYGDFRKASISQKTYAEAFSPILEYGKKTALPPLQLTANYYNTVNIGGKNLSILSSLSYKNEPRYLDVDRQQNQSDGFRISRENQSTDAAQLSLLQNFSYNFSDKSKFYFKNFLLQQGQQYTLLSNARNGLFPFDGIYKDLRGRDVSLRNIVLTWTQRFLYSGNIGGEHQLGKSDKHHLDWNAGYTYSRLDMPDQRIIRLQNNNNYNDSRFPKAGDFEQNFVPVFRSELNLNNNVELGHITRLWTRNNENVYNGSADYSFNYKPWITLKAGTYQQWKERVVFRRVYTVNEGDLNSNGYPDFDTPTIGAFAPDMDFNTVFWRQQDLGKLWSTSYLRDNNTGLKVFDRTSGSDAYTATEQNNSGYIAASLLPFGSKLDIYGGIRVEYNRQKVAGAIAPSAAAVGDVNTPVLADLKSTQYFPSLNISYRPDSSWVFRAAYGKTINRPEFRELSPYSELDYINNQRIVGNSGLVFATVNNYDLRLEWYPANNQRGETISIGAFKKDITNPIERTIYRELDPSYSDPALISFQNAGKAKVFGIELDFRKSLHFIPGRVFRDLSVVANGTYIHSGVKTDTAGKVFAPEQLRMLVAGRKLQGQASYSFNAGLYYDNAGSGTRAAVIYNEVGERIYAAAVGRKAGTQKGTYPDFGTSGSLIELPRRQLDLSLTQRIVKSLQAKFSVQNLLNQSVAMVEDHNFTFKYEKVQYIPGLKTSNSTQSDAIEGDTPASSYKPGRFYLLTLTYGF